MKQILKIWIVAVLAIIPAISNAHSGCDQEMTQIKIIRTETAPSTGIDRSLNINTSNISAYIVNATNEVEVNIWGIGETEVYILDSTGQTVDYSSVNTDIPSTIYLSTNGPGCYYLVIISDTCYAEGAFAI
jgi:hypothetical protein